MGEEFYIYKFRSMVQNAEHTGSGVYSGKNDARVTKVGKIIRAASIDELPQAVNMLKGDMSLIGPRPPLTYHPLALGGEYTAGTKENVRSTAGDYWLGSSTWAKRCGMEQAN